MLEAEQKQAGFDIGHQVNLTRDQRQTQTGSLKILANALSRTATERLPATSAAYDVRFNVHLSSPSHNPTGLAFWGSFGQMAHALNNSRIPDRFAAHFQTC